MTAPRQSAATTCAHESVTPARPATSVRPRGARTTTTSSSASTIARPQATRAAPSHTTGSAFAPEARRDEEPAREQRQRDPQRALRRQVVAQHDRQKVERRAAHRKRQDAEREQVDGEHRGRRQRAAVGEIAGSGNRGPGRREPADHGHGEVGGQQRAGNRAADCPPLGEREGSQLDDLWADGLAHRREAYRNRHGPNPSAAARIPSSKLAR